MSSSFSNAIALEVYVYDDRGNLTEKTEYDDDGSIDEKWVYTSVANTFGGTADESYQASGNR